jgi:tol-pal system protein YbgF
MRRTPRGWLLILFAAYPLLVAAGGRGAPVVEPAAGDIAQRLAKIERLLESQGLLDLYQQLQSLQTELQQLRGDLEVQRHQLEELEERQRRSLADLDRRLAALERSASAAPPSPAGTPETAAAQEPPLETLATVPPPAPAGTAAAPGTALTVEPVAGGGAAAAPAGPGTAATPAAPSPATTTPAETTAVAAAAPAPAVPAGDPLQERAAYESAFELLKAARYNEAIDAFNRFLAAYPSGEYAANAQYWLGEAYYVQRRYQEAIPAYEKLIADHAHNPKVPHGLLKIGYSYQELGQVDTARTRLEELVQRFPGTTAARLAEERLQQIKTTRR